MNWKKLFAYSSSFIYLILISLFMYFVNKDLICGIYGKPCLRFCSKETKEYSDKMLFDEFINSSISDYFPDELDLVNIFRGPPSCDGELTPLNNLTKASEYNEEEEEDVDDEDDYYKGRISIYASGAMYEYGKFYTANTFCLERDESLARKFFAMVCIQKGFTLQQSILVTISIISISILLPTLATYLYFPKLRDFYGKMIIWLLISMISTSIGVPGFFDDKKYIFKVFGFIMVFGVTSGNLWLNSMVLNIYFRIRDFRSSNAKNGQFSSYASYVAVFTSFVLVFILYEMSLLRGSYFVEFITIVHSYLIFNDLVLLIITSFSIRNISKQIGFSEREQLDKEKKIFWNCVKLFAIMSLTWSTQIYAFEKEDEEFSFLIVGFIMLFSACNVAGLFLGRKKVRDLVTNGGKVEENC